MGNILRARTRQFCRALYLSAALFLLAIPAYSDTLKIESETLIRTFERETSSGHDEHVLPIYEYLSLDADRLKSKYLSFHVYGWGRHDLSDSAYFKDDTDGELIYAYLEYADSYRNRNLKLGRQHIFAGVANDSIDGLSLASDLGNQFSASVYGGLPVGLADTAGRSGDSIWGGRLAHRFGIFSNIGLSYQGLENDSDTVTSTLGIDSAFLLPKNIGLYGNSVRNMETEGWAEHNYWLHLYLGNLSIRPYYEMYEYDDYFDAGALNGGPFMALVGNGEQLETLGLDVSWQQSPSWTFGSKTKQYSYELSDTSNYFSLSAIWTGSFSTQAGGEIGQMQGDAADNDYLLLRLFCYVDQLSAKAWVDFISGDSLYTLYDQEIYGQDYAYFVSLGSGKMFLDGKLEMKLSADYSQDPYFDSDLRSMLTATYRFGTDHSL